MPLGSVLIGDRFARYTAIFAASIYRDFENSDAASIIVHIRIIIILFDRSITPF
jgi:hypothetical protein